MHRIIHWAFTGGCLYIVYMQGISTGELLQRIRQNDRQLLTELRIVIESIARRWRWSDADHLDDIAQDCLLKLIDNLQRGRFKGESSIKTYVYAIARNTCIDYYKACRVVDMTDIDSAVLVEPGASQEDQVISAEERRTAARVLLSMSFECRRLWRAIFYGNRTYKQAAELLKLKEGTVKRKMWECRQMAREKVEVYEK